MIWGVGEGKLVLALAPIHNPDNQSEDSLKKIQKTLIPAVSWNVKAISVALPLAFEVAYLPLTPI